MKRLREEKRAKETGSKPPIASATTSAAAEPQPVPNGELWAKESLFERNVRIEGGTGPGRGSIIRLLEDPTGTLAGGNGATLWDCSIALTRALAERYDGRDLTGSTVLELGAGLGLVGMAMAAMGARVLTTERPIALPLLRRNVEHNQEVTGGRVAVAELSWGAGQTRALLAERNKSGAPTFDIVVGSDVVFPSNSDAYPLLADTLTVLLEQQQQKNGKDEAVEIWQCHEPRRPDVEAKFWTMLDDRGICVHRVTAQDGILPNSHPEDIMIYKLTLPSSIAAAATLASIAPAEQKNTTTTTRDPNTLHNFGPASHRDSVLFTSERPGGDPQSGVAVISASTVQEWIDFMKGKGITDVLVLLDNNELEIYESPGLLAIYEKEGLTAHRAPMGEAGACERVMRIIRNVQKKSQGKIVAHCTHGMGRSGRVAAGWLAKEYGLSPIEATDEAMALAREKGMERLGAPHLLEKWLLN